MSTEAERYARLHEILQHARNLDGAALTDYLEAASAGDDELNQQVLAMLDAGRDEEKADAFAEDNVRGVRLDLEGMVDEATPDRMPESIGGYTIVRRIGHGGMGVVYEAEQSSPRRRVALKVIRSSMATDELLRRFRREVRVLAQLHHPGIAQIFDAGTDESGGRPRPYFAMELVDGEPLDRYADHHELDASARLELIAQVCDALHHAHQKGVVQRDLKPANILVPADAESTSSSHRTGVAALPQPKILDFGVARATDADLATVTLHTTEGQLIGTVPYMSPEQAAGVAEAIDHRSDVYALGVIAFELLAGCFPYGVRGKLVHEAVRVIREDEPSSLGSLDRALRGDIETIVGKALAKEPERRYQSAAEMAADIRRYIDHLPIEARPPSTFYQLRKFARRNKAVVAGAVATLVVALAGAGVATYFAIDANHRADELLQVTRYQASQLGEIDAQQMASGLRELVLAELQLGADGETSGDTGGLAARIDRINFNGIALRSLYDNFFARSIAGIRQRFSDQPAVEGRLLQPLAWTMFDLGLREEAVAPYERAIEVQRRALGEDHLETLKCRLEYGWLLHMLGRSAEGVAHVRAGLEGYRRQLPYDHPDLRAAVEWSAAVFGSAGEEEAGLELRRELIDLFARDFGKDHIKTLEARMAVLLAEGRNEEAVTAFEKILALAREEFGDDALFTLITLRNFSGHLLSMERFEEAERRLREALAGFRPLLGEGHSQTWGAAGMLSVALVRQGKLEDAENHVADMLARQRTHLAEDHEAVRATTKALADIRALRADLAVQEDGAASTGADE